MLMSRALSGIGSPSDAVMSCRPLLPAVREARDDIATEPFERALASLESRMDAASVARVSDELGKLLAEYRRNYGLDGPWVI